MACGNTVASPERAPLAEARGKLHVFADLAHALDAVLRAQELADLPPVARERERHPGA